MENTALYEALKRPPKEALRTIQQGPLKGKSDINPQWRYRAMTAQFGPVGFGWRYEITELWMNDGHNINDRGDKEIAAFARVNLYIKANDEWSVAIPGIGGSTFVAATKHGPQTSDEAYKMAVTDALSVAMKALGVAADIYAGLWDGSKYRDAQPQSAPQKPTSRPHAPPQQQKRITKADGDKIRQAREKAGLSADDVLYIANSAPYSVNGNMNNLLKVHVPKLIEAIQKQGEDK